MRRNREELDLDEGLAPEEGLPQDLEVIDADAAFHEGMLDPYQGKEGLGIIGGADNITIEKGDADLNPSGRHAKPPQPEYMRKSRRMRKILLVIIIILVALIIAGCILGYQLFQTANTAATQQTQSQDVSLSTFTDEGAATKDASDRKSVV